MDCLMTGTKEAECVLHIQRHTNVQNERHDFLKERGSPVCPWMSFVISSTLSDDACCGIFSTWEPKAPPLILFRPMEPHVPPMGSLFMVVAGSFTQLQFVLSSATLFTYYR